jgi:Ca2+-transporting ATPase
MHVTEQSVQDISRVSLLEAHAHPIPHVVRLAATDLVAGLSHQEARARRAHHGPNTLPAPPDTPLWRQVVAQLVEPLVLLLLGAAVLSALLGEVVDAAAILAIVVLNATLGVVQEARAARSLRALRTLVIPTVQTLRDGQWTSLPAAELVPGDVVQVQSGDRVPADLRLLETSQLQINEAALTGESTPVAKRAETVLDPDVALGDCINSAFMGTMVTTGRGRGLVIATGGQTQLGRIAALIAVTEAEATPLQRRLARLGWVLSLAALALCGLMFVGGVLRGLAPLPMFMTAVSLAIAAVPEGLPATVTMCLALGTQRMLRRHALMRQLPAVETLGSATVICTDKTGTLTQNVMTVARLFVDDTMMTVTGDGYAPHGAFLCEGTPINPTASIPLLELCRAAVLCNDAQLQHIGPDNAAATAWQIVGEPTEGALAVLAAKAGLWRTTEERAAPRVTEISFDAQRKRMTTIHRRGDRFMAYVKGAPESVLACCHRELVAGAVRPLDAARRACLVRVATTLADDGLRVLALARRVLPALPDPADAATVECELELLGFAGLHDPPRPEVGEAISVARQAGLRTIMITGDHPATARAIGRTLGMEVGEGAVLDGATLNAMSEAALVEATCHVSVFARVTPEQKLRIVQALRARGEVVAMTGDGMNDAPALKQADIGVAMGLTGTDVAKDTADMVLTDDNYASIVAAVEEGRTIYANIRKCVFYLLSCNIGEMGVVCGAILLGWPVPLRPIHLLWLNLITDGLPALALGLERGDPDTMRQPPRAPSEPLLDGMMRWGISLQGMIITVATLAVFQGALYRHGDLTMAQTMALVTLVSCELLRAFTARSERHSLWASGICSNRFLVGAVASSLALLLAVVSLPWLNPMFHTVALPGQAWLSVLPWVMLPALVAELTKGLQRRGWLGGHP